MGLLSELRANHADLLAAIRTEQELTDDTQAKLKDAVEAYAKNFVA